MEGILDENDSIAAKVKADLGEKGVLVVNEMGAPGVGKTTTLKNIFSRLKNVKPYVIEGDIEADFDTKDLQASGVQTLQINTYGSCGFVLEEGLEIETLDRVAKAMAEEAASAGVKIVAGDTKVIEGHGGMFINTSGIGIIPEERSVRAANCRPGDKLILSGDLGDHHEVAADTFKVIGLLFCFNSFSYDRQIQPMGHSDDRTENIAASGVIL